MLTYRRCGPEVVDELEPMTRELFAAIADADAHPAVPHLDSDTLWRRRRARYRTWLDAGGFVIIADDDGVVIGYALVSLDDDEDDFDFGTPVAEMQSLVVTAARRGEGVGAALVREVRAVLKEAGVTSMIVGVLSSNRAAASFYETQGMAPWAIQFVDRAR